MSHRALVTLLGALVLVVLVAWALEKEGLDMGQTNAVYTDAGLPCSLGGSRLSPCLYPPVMPDVPSPIMSGAGSSTSVPFVIPNVGSNLMKPYVDPVNGFELLIPATWSSRGDSSAGPWDFQSTLFANNFHGIGIPPEGNMWVSVAKGICNDPTPNFVGSSEVYAGVNVSEQVVCKDNFQITADLYADDQQLAAHQALLEAIVDSFQTEAATPTE